MKINFDNKKAGFVISEIDYEMMQILMNGLYNERKKIIDKISDLNTYLFKDYLEYQKTEFRVQISHLKEKNEKLTKTFNAFDLYFKNIPI